MRIRIPNGPDFRNSLQESLQMKGFKSTQGRRTILGEIETRKEHFNADDLYLSITRKGPRVSKPTIYRTLKVLEKLRLIERFDVKKNCFYYEPVFQKADHGHLICEACGEIVDFSLGNFNMLESAALKEKDFTLDYVSIRFFGLCENCRRIPEGTRVSCESIESVRR